jgi:parallel beta-helix repeat protein
MVGGRMKRILTIGVILLFIGSISSSMGFNLEKKSISSLNGDIFYVDDDFNESTSGWNVTHFANIRDALNVVSDGDTIFVYSGKYTGHIRINKSINLLGENKNATYIIGLTGKPISIISDFVNINGFTIKSRDSSYRGISIESKYNTIKNNIVISNYILGAIDIGGNRNIIDSNILLGNIGIAVWAGNNIISNNTILVNETGIFFGASSERNKIIKNIIRGSSVGNAIESEYCNYHVISSNIISDFEYGITISNGIHFTIANNIISSNKENGIILSSLGFHNVIGNHIINNKEGIALNGIGNVIKRNNFINNSKRNAHFVQAVLNKWDRNYWDEPREYPYPIFGSLGILPSIFMVFVALCPGTLIIPLFGAIALFLISCIFCYLFPTWINFDWHPAQEPYDIGG